MKQYTFDNPLLCLYGTNETFMIKLEHRPYKMHEAKLSETNITIMNTETIKKLEPS
jgi:hypothetical protein